jgi:acetyltransferase-like isoleucine patch superfamily enzyme
MIVKLREFIRWLLLQVNYVLLTKVYKMNISRTARISLGAKLDKTRPKRIYIDDESYVASGALIFSHDYSRSLQLNTFIGKKCFIGANSIIMPGITIGDHVIVGAGSVVTKDIPSGCIVAGNPAIIIRNQIITTKYGKLIEKSKRPIQQ